MSGPVRIGPVERDHAGELFTVQRAAYVSEAQRYAEAGIPPLVETLDEVEADVVALDVLVLGAWLGRRLVGSVRGRIDGARMEIARFAVAPDMQGRGVGRDLLLAVEAATPRQVVLWWLVTGARSTENLRLYVRAGYRRAGERTDATGITLALLEKPVDADAQLSEPRLC